MQDNANKCDNIHDLEFSLCQGRPPFTMGQGRRETGVFIPECPSLCTAGHAIAARFFALSRESGGKAGGTSSKASCGIAKKSPQGRKPKLRAIPFLVEQVAPMRGSACSKEYAYA